MKGNIAVQTQHEKLQDEGKLAYMIAWRDRKIAAMQDMLEAGRQKDAIYAAYMVYLLSRLGEEIDGQRQICVPKADIRALCGGYRVEARDGGEDFVIILQKKEETDGKGCGEVADA